MIVIEKDVGTKIPYEVVEEKITFDDNLTINLVSREKDWPVHIDICYDEDYNLVIGAAAGRTYVAQIDILERQYYETEVDGEVQRIPIPLDMGTVTLFLWSIE